MVECSICTYLEPAVVFVDCVGELYSLPLLTQCPHARLSIQSNVISSKTPVDTVPPALLLVVQQVTC